MATEIFIDTSGFYSLLSKRDSHHEAAVRILETAGLAKRRFVTTDYVLDETATLLKTRRLGHLVTPLFDHIFDSRACRVEWMDAIRFSTCRDYFARHSDHGYSFTDCFSFVLMSHLRLSDALTKDQHFAEAGFMPLL